MKKIYSSQNSAILMAEYVKTCPVCQKTFVIRNKFIAITRNRTYCSSECKFRQIRFNENYFTDLTQSKLHTLGQFVATAHIENPQIIIVKTDLTTIDKIKKELDSEHIPTRADWGLWSLRFCSRRLVDSLVSVPISRNQYLQEFPPYDCLSGILDTHWLKSGEFRHWSHKLVLEVQAKLGGEIRTETFKDTYKGVLGCHWVLSGFDGQEK